MAVVMQVGARQIQDRELYPLLAQYQFLPRLAREIIVDQAIVDIGCSAEEQDRALAFFCQQNQIANEESLQGFLAQSGMTLEQLKAYVVRDLKLEQFKRKTWEDQIEGHFLASKDKLDRVVYSLIRTREPGIAQELYFRIQEGEEDFAQLARQYSEGGEAETGGLIGPVELNVPHPQIVQILKTTPAGQLAPPAQIGEWWVVLRLEKYLASQLDDAMRARLRNDLFQRWLLNQLQKEVKLFPPPEAETPAPIADSSDLILLESPWDAP
ncbi:MAG: peptidylprolyl isomerase [Cyanobacteria bacterium RI_101]|nr:peptidylprolyl isomerase [Cyanobacteria bacterium RI_101]